MTFCSKHGLADQHNTGISCTYGVQLHAAGGIAENQPEPKGKGKNGILGFSKRKLFGGVILGVLAILLGVGLFLQADRNLYSKFWCFLLILVGIGDLVGTMYLLRRYRSIVNC